MGKAGGGRNEVDPRFISLFSVFHVTFPSNDSLFHIYDSLLTGHFAPFKQEVREMSDIVTRVTMSLYDQIVLDLPPTPSKFHYIFNLRDLSRIYHGLYLTIPDRFNEPKEIVRVWRNECLRIFSDRLTNEKDKEYVRGKILDLLNENFSQYVEYACVDPVLFGDYRTSLQPDQPRIYENIQVTVATYSQPIYVLVG